MIKSYALKRLSDAYPNIMADIGTNLTAGKVKCKTSRLEVVAIDTNKKSVKKAISPLIDTDDSKLLLDVISARGNVYIRRKCRI